MSVEGLVCIVYRPAGDDIRLEGYIGRSCIFVTLYGRAVPRVHEAAHGAPPVELIRGIAYPMNGEKAKWTFGGCFVWLDSPDFPAKHPIPLYDKPKA